MKTDTDDVNLICLENGIYDLKNNNKLTLSKPGNNQLQ